MAFRYDDVEQSLRDSIEKGVVAIRRINSGEEFEQWLAVGRACADMQLAAMRLAHTNEAKGRGYNDAYKVIADQVPDLAKLNKTTRSHAVWVADPSRREEIIAWHARLPDNIRQNVNHPTTVWRRYQRDTVVPTEDGEAPAKGGGLKGEVARLQQELDEATAKLRKAERNRDNVSEGRDWSWADSDDDIAAAWYRLQPTKAVRIASKVLQLHKPATPKPKVKRGAAA